VEVFDLVAIHDYGGLRGELLRIGGWANQHRE